MTITEILTIIGCFVLGFWLVAVFVPNASSKRHQRGHDVPPDPDGQTNASAASTPWRDVLGVPANATRDEVTTAYRRAIRQYHPDKVVGLGDEIGAFAQGKAVEINTAYDRAMRELPR